MKRIVLLYCVALCCAGCNTYKTYSGPEIQTDGLFGSEVELADTVSIADFSWRELFVDSKLQELVDSGLVHNSDLRIALLRVQEAEASLKASRMAYFPSVSFAPQGQLNGSDGNKAVGSYSLALSANWELDLAGKLTNEKRSAVASFNMNRAYRQAVHTQLVATIANGYYNLLMLDAQLAISRRTLDSWEETLRALREQKNVGYATEAAVSQALANKVSIEGTLLSLQRQIKEQENSLSVLVGMPPGPIRRSSLVEQNFPEELSVGIPLQLLKNRPDVRQAEFALQRAFYATNVAYAAFYPQVTLVGTIGWANTDGSSIVNPGKWLWNAIGSLVQPLFNRGNNIANLKIARAQQEEALIAFRQKLLEAGAEVNNALTQWQTARQRLDIDRQQISALQKAVRSTQLLMLYSSGASYLEVLTAQQTLLQAELAETQDVYNKIQGIINLYHALGGGID